MESKFDLVTKLGICRQKGIDFLSADENISRENRLNTINSILAKIMANPDLAKKLDEIDDKFWEQALQTGVLVYSEPANTPNGEDEYLVAKKHQFHNETFETIDGQQVKIGRGDEIPALVYQIKKRRF